MNVTPVAIWQKTTYYKLVANKLVMMEYMLFKINVTEIGKVTYKDVGLCNRWLYLSNCMTSFYGIYFMRVGLFVHTLEFVFIN